MSTKKQREKWINDHMDKVKILVSQQCEEYGEFVSWDELLSVGCEGLVKAARGFVIRHGGGTTLWMPPI